MLRRQSKRAGDLDRTCRLSLRKYSAMIPTGIPARIAHDVRPSG